MDNFSCVFKEFLKKNILLITLFLLSYIIIFLLCFLYSVNFEIAIYFVLLTLALNLSVGLYRFIRFYYKHNKLQSIIENCVISDLDFVKSANVIEDDYQKLVKKFNKLLEQTITQKDTVYEEMTDYYTIWAHQIKTPISATNLLLQTEETSLNYDISEQLFRIEQYVEMALQYLRMSNMSNDLLIKTYSLDSIVKKSIKKFAKLFIRKRITLEYSDLNCSVLTDEKWIQFVIEQILSNSLKYTNKGKISIYMDEKLSKTLVIEDTGIGIEKEDLPRVFEKGFTGYNGREDKKSTGIGLFLCKNIVKKLSHTISIESEVSVGTKIRLGLETLNIFHE
ncbi:sensor histidine kinase [Sedimentibacter sp. zth1]|uniref:sensor histidine kinase n=1 Tax=Sedimentibacter sp. zth1 TaxID=2816908 RepID=UPI001A92CDC5|nr:sensor histidine kinase [Sedimentibacter sp. zth1]QSX05039.1 sensor histidine kinase [Sedimentibacter sp. zth1]